MLKSTFPYLTPFPSGILGNPLGAEQSSLIEQGLTSAPTQYRLYGRRFYRTVTSVSLPANFC